MLFILIPTLLFISYTVYKVSYIIVLETKTYGFKQWFTTLDGFCCICFWLIMSSVLVAFTFEIIDIVNKYLHV